MLKLDPQLKRSLYTLPLSILTLSKASFSKNKPKMNFRPNKHEYYMHYKDYRN